MIKAASPLAQVPCAAGDLLLIHGLDDERVPIAHTRVYARALKAAGGAVTLWEAILATPAHDRARSGILAGCA